MRAFTLAAVLSAAWATTGCIGPSCQSTCNKIFGEPPDQCGLQVPGKELEESFKDCRDECEFALTQAGEIGDYDPFEANTGGFAATLDNEKQAAMWMDCVEQHSCQDLSEGFCAPTGF